MKYAVWLSGLVTYAEAATILNTIGEIPISVSSLWRRVGVWGPKCQALETTQRAVSMAFPTREELNQTTLVAPQDLGAAMDGGLVHIREEGWKELKVGCVFAVQVRPTRDNHTGETVDLAHAVANTYVAHLGGPASSAKPCGPRRGNATGCKPTRRWYWAMGPLGSGTWRRISSLPVAKSWIGITPNCI
ncbi:hypothetical protein BURK2_04483 [Burkholderiales bacterium]|nr:hypothetical protein BURK2_04483 [Burkholderiales bacterium]